MVNEKLEKAREKVKRLKMQQKAKKRAKAREKSKRRERIKDNNPEGLREKAQASVHQGKKLAGEFGVSRDRAAQFAPSSDSDSGGPSLPGLTADDGQDSQPQLPDFGGLDGGSGEPRFPGVSSERDRDSSPSLPAFGGVDDADDTRPQMPMDFGMGPRERGEEDEDFRLPF